MISVRSAAQPGGFGTITGGGTVGSGATSDDRWMLAGSFAQVAGKKNSIYMSRREIDSLQNQQGNIKKQIFDSANGSS